MSELFVGEDSMVAPQKPLRVVFEPDPAAIPLRRVRATLVQAQQLRGGE
jgi:hypothetical protein